MLTTDKTRVMCDFLTNLNVYYGFYCYFIYAILVKVRCKPGFSVQICLIYTIKIYKYYNYLQVKLIELILTDVSML